MGGADLDSVASLHLAAFPHFFLTSLGQRALRELYAGMLDDTAGITLIAEADGRMLGFAAGTIDSRWYYRRLLVRRWWRFVRAIALQALRRPSLLFRLGWRVRSATTSAPRPGEAVLLSVAVSPSQQGRGAGRALVAGFIAAAREKNARSVSLTTDAVDNQRVQQFYQSLGFHRRAEYATPEHRLIHEYVIDL